MTEPASVPPKSDEVAAEEPLVAHTDDRWILWAISTIHALRDEVARLKAEAEQLVEQVQDKDAEIARLRERLGTHFEGLL
jgi:molecular chaperone GrpE (heat shock protein)